MAATSAPDDLCEWSSTLSTPPGGQNVAELLRSRSLSDQPYTALGHSSLISINPHKPVHVNADAELYSYLAESWDLPQEGASPRRPLAPHIWQLASRAYAYTRRTGQDQAIILTGASGSGKSEYRRQAIRALVEVAAPAPGKKGSKLVQSIPSAEYILECFGHASSALGANASFFGRYSEIQYGEKHRIAGCKFLDYHLDATRVSGPPRGERSFHVMHQLVAGASKDESAHLHLEAAGGSGFRYLGSASATADDHAKFDLLKQAFKSVGFPQRAVASICQVLAAILHLGQLEFLVDHTRNADAALVSNVEQLALTASLLGVEAEALESSLNVSTRSVGNDRVTAFLDPEGCRSNADELARNLYRLLFSWLTEYLSSKLARDDFTSFISVIDLPGLRSTGGKNGLESFIFNLANERLHAFVLEHSFERYKADFEREGVASLLPGLQASYFGNAECVRILTSFPGGLVHITDDQACRRGKTDATMLDAMGKRWGSHSSFGWRAGDNSTGRVGTFTINHFDGQVQYDTEGMLDADRAAISTDFVSLFADSGAVDGTSGTGTAGSSNPFLQQLFAREAEEAREAVKKGFTRAGSLRARPTIRRKADKNEVDEDKEPEEDAKTKLKGDTRCHLGTLNANLDVLLDALRENRVWHILCLKPNDAGLPNQVDLKVLRQQVGSMGIPELTRRLQGQWAIGLSHKDVWDRFAKSSVHSLEALRLNGMAWSDKLSEIRSLLGFREVEFAIGKSKVFLSAQAYSMLENFVRAGEEHELKMAKMRAQQEVEARAGLMPADRFSPFASAVEQLAGLSDPQTGYGTPRAYVDSPRSDFDTKSGYFNDAASRFDDGATTVGSVAYMPRENMFRGGEKDHFALAEKGSGGGIEEPTETVEIVRTGLSRRLWVILTWAFTWWVPSFLLKWPGKLKRGDVRMAWREKLLINMLIWLICAIAVFVIVFMGDLICPHQYVFNTAELSSGSFINDPANELVAIRGEVFDLTNFAPKHSPSIVSLRSIQKYGGLDASNLFPVQVSALCQGASGSISPWITLDVKNTSEPNAMYHDFRAAASTTDFRPDWYMETMIYLRSNYRKGFMGFTTSAVQKLSQQPDTRNTVIYRGGVYDMTGYIENGGGQPASPPGTSTPPVSASDRAFMDQEVTDILVANGGNDVTDLIDGLPLSRDQLEAQRTCLRNLFFIGKVDTRNSAQCQFSRYFLLAISILIVAIIGFKFLAALNFSRSRMPEDFDKFVICQVPCYTEGEDSLKKCLQSLAATNYDDKRKLIFVICDGNIVGSGNDKSTPRIVLDILGADPALDPEPLSFQSLGEGAKQHNMGKVYSGLYEHAGHIVPYIVLVKVGKPSERSKPGNRGKRDSQLIVMRFLNRIIYNAPMSPCELELFHQLKNVIGVIPSFYEYLLSIDADTVVHPDALSRMIGTVMRDRKIIGLCGETTLSNARHSWVTSVQVYEYFISHHMAKAFESLFGSVTCLPGCFTLFRIRTLEGKPLFCSKQVVDAFSLNRVDTLHLKNLLHLGEDRYLTTLLLKNFPTHKTSFCRDAKAQTIAPDEWKVLLSQRRRWINSTVHNLYELLMIDRLCGFCCFSMRFVVLVDLTATIKPVTLAYLIYLVYVLATTTDQLPFWALLMLGVIYGLQIFVFVVLRAFDMIGWLVLYILAIPVFTLFLPLYSFWHMDDFSWGATRVIMGEKGKRLVTHDEGTFDPSEIPLQTWQEYEQHLWETGSNASIGELIAQGHRAPAMPPRDISVYGRASYMNLNDFPPPQQHSPAASIRSSPKHQPRPSMASLAPPSHFARPSDTTLQWGGSRPFSTMLQMDTEALVQHGTPYTDDPLGYLPTDERIAADIQAIVSTADLSHMSKKLVRQELERRYGVSLGDKTAFANAEIERAALAAY